MSPSLTAEAVSERLAGCVLAREVRYFRELPSTNDRAFQLALEGAPEGTVVVADRQTRGRGRMNRVWISPPERNVYLSVVLRPDVAPERAPQLSIVAGVAAAEALRTYSPAAGLKWPNDVLIGNRKVCGILAEMRVSAGRLDFVILGIGINVNLLPEECPPEIAGTATSLRAETGRFVSRPEVIERLIHALEAAYRTYLQDGFPPSRERWLAMTDMAGGRVRIVSGEGAYEGRMIGLDDAGALLLEEETGAVRAVMAGDASLVKG
jgi:BirA family biotin operon repressor/biotin-[acetyl-CoA-carboxylase] ligase